MKQPIKILVPDIHWEPETFIQNLILGLSFQNFTFFLGSTKKNILTNHNPKNIFWIKTHSFSPNFIKTSFSVFHHYLFGFVFDFKRAKIFFAHSIKYNLRNLYRSSPFIKGNFDIIYFPWNSSAIELNFLFQLNIPTIISCRGSQINIAPFNPKRSYMLEGLKTTLSESTYIHCVSNSIAKEAQKYCGDFEKIKTIYTGVDTDFFSFSKEKKNSLPTIVSIGNQSWKKGFEYALIAMYHLRNTGLDFKYHIIGENHEVERLLLAIDYFNLSKFVTIHGKLPKEKIKAIFNDSHIYLLPSVSEGISNAAVEAMASGLPVIAFDIGGNREFIENNINGFIVNTRDSYQLSEALKHFLGNPELRRKCSLQARKTAVEMFSLEKNISGFSQLLQNATNC